MPPDTPAPLVGLSEQRPKPEYRLVVVAPGGARNPWLGVDSWELLLRDVRGFFNLKRDGRIRAGCTVHVERRDYGPAPWVIA